MKIMKYALVLTIALTALSLPKIARADTTYTYTGHADTSCFGSYTCNGTTPSLSLTFDTTLSGSALDNLSNAYITGSVSDFTFTDGAGLVMTQADPLTIDSFFVTTDGAGDITAWSIDVESPSSLGNNAFNAISSCSTLSLCPTQGIVSDFSDLGRLNQGLSFAPGGGGGEVDNNPGSWSPPISTPEPSSLLLLGTGLLGLVGKLGLYRKRFS